MVKLSRSVIRWVSIALMFLSSASSFAGMRPEEVKEFEEHKVKAEKGDPESQQSLGWCYFFGSGVAKDAAEGIKWWRKAAEKGNATAQQNLGSAYQSGEFVAWSGVEAMKWFRMAAEQGLPVALHTLGGKYESGSGVVKDESEAYAYYTLAGATLEFSRNALAVLEEKMTVDARLRGKQRAKELQKEIEAKIAAKKAGKVEPVKHSARLYPDDSRPEGLFGHAEAMSRPNIVFIDNRLPAFRSFKKAYYQVENQTDKLRASSILVSMYENELKLVEIKKYRPDNDENVTRGMLLMNEWAAEARKLTAELHGVLGE